MFSGVRNINFVQNSRFQVNATTTASLIRKYECYKLEGQTLSFPMRNQLLIYRNTFYHSVFSWVRNVTFVPYNPIKVNARSTVSLAIQTLMIEARGSSTLFSSGNRVKF
jgi:hypothetical protein